MDRNLYERANDCRWWALAAVFAEPAVASDTVRAGRRETIGSILRTINGLYTVYSNLIVLDGDGRIVATSNAASELAGTGARRRHGSRALLRVCADAQGYAVSALRARRRSTTTGPTYIYGAAIRTPQQPQAVGGVAIVFDPSRNCAPC